MFDKFFDESTAGVATLYILFALGVIFSILFLA